MKKNEQLTNEQLTNLLSNKFRLARIAIDLARHHIEAGIDFTASSLLLEMKKHPGFLHDQEEDKAS